MISVNSSRPQIVTNESQKADSRFDAWCTQLSELISMDLPLSDARRWIVDLIQRDTNIATYSLEELKRFKLQQSPFQKTEKNTYSRTFHNLISDIILANYFGDQSKKVALVMPELKQVLKINIRLITIGDVFKQQSVVSNANLTVGALLHEGLNLVKRKESSVDTVINYLMQNLKSYLGDDALWIEGCRFSSDPPTKIINTQCVQEIETEISSVIQENIRPKFIEAMSRVRLLGTTNSSPEIEGKLALISNRSFPPKLHQILNRNGFRADQRSLIQCLIKQIGTFNKLTVQEKLSEWTTISIEPTRALILLDSHKVRLGLQKMMESSITLLVKSLFNRLITLMQNSILSPYFVHQLAVLTEKAHIDTSPHAVMRSTQRLLELYLHFCSDHDGDDFISEYTKNFLVVPVLKGMTVFGLSAISMALAASSEMFKNPTIEILTKDYFEILELANAQIMFKAIQKEKLRAISTTCDIAIVDLHPNNAAQKFIQSNPIYMWIEEYMPLRNKKLLLIVDATTSDISDSDIQELITHSNSWINEGKLSLVIAQSLTKFAQFGADILSAGAIAVFHDPLHWGTFHTALNSLISSHAISTDYYRFFGGLMKHAPDLRQEYIHAIRDNVNQLTKSFYESVAELPIDEDCLLMRLIINTDQNTCYIGFHFDFLFAKVTHITNSAYMLSCPGGKEYSDLNKQQFVKTVFSNLIMPLSKEQNLPISERMSIGFQVSNLNNCGETLRFALGIEDEALISKYSDFFAEIAYIISVHPNLPELLNPADQFLEAKRYFEHVQGVLSNNFESVISGITIKNEESLALDLHIRADKIYATIREKTAPVSTLLDQSTLIPMEFSGDDDFNMQGFSVDDVRRPLLISLYEKDFVDFEYYQETILISNFSLRASDFSHKFDMNLEGYTQPFSVYAERDVGKWNIGIYHGGYHWDETKIFLEYDNDRVPVLNLPDKQSFRLGLSAENYVLVEFDENRIVFT